MRHALLMIEPLVRVGAKHRVRRNKRASQGNVAVAPDTTNHGAPEYTQPSWFRGRLFVLQPHLEG